MPGRDAGAPRARAKADRTRAKRVRRVPGPEARATFARLRALHPDAHCELTHDDPFQLLCATVLSAQTTDVAVNRVTPELFSRWPDAAAMARARPADVEKAIGSIGMFRQKAKNLVGLATALIERHGGRVPGTLEALVELPGVGRKTANVVLGVAFGQPEGVVVDTHVQRIAQRLGWTRETDPARIERALSRLLPRTDWDATSHVLIFHGRRVCFARRPACETCAIHDVCPSAFDAEHVGRKPPRARARVAPASAAVRKSRRPARAS